MYSTINLIDGKKKVWPPNAALNRAKGICGRTRARCSCDIGYLLLYSVRALDCAKQVIFMMNLIYLNSIIVANVIFLSAKRSHIRF